VSIDAPQRSFDRSPQRFALLRAPAKPGLSIVDIARARWYP